MRKLRYVGESFLGTRIFPRGGASIIYAQRGGVAGGRARRPAACSRRAISARRASWRAVKDASGCVINPALAPLLGTPPPRVGSNRSTPAGLPSPTGCITGCIVDADRRPTATGRRRRPAPARRRAWPAVSRNPRRRRRRPGERSGRPGLRPRRDWPEQKRRMKK